MEEGLEKCKEILIVVLLDGRADGYYKRRKSKSKYL